MGECLVCKGTELEEILALKQMPLTDEFIDEDNESLKKEFTGNITILQCKKCGLIQKKEVNGLSEYYREYGYSCGTSQFMKNFANKLANKMTSIYRESTQRNPKNVIEVGGGDGEQLRAFENLVEGRLINIEPSERLEAMNGNNIEVVGTMFPNEEVKEKVGCKSDMIVSSYTFDHSDNPIEFLVSCNKLLESNGLICLEVHDIDLICENNEFCLFEHEHYIYMNSEYLTRLLSCAGFEIIAINPIEKKDVRANSLIVIGRKIQDKCSIEIKATNEMKLKSSLSVQYKKYVDKLRIWRSQNKDVVGFGAGGRGVMTCAHTMPDKLVDVVYDSAIKRDGLKMPSSRIDIRSIDHISENKDKAVIVFSYGYYQEIKEFLVASGYKPNKVISMKDVCTEQ